MSGRQMGRSGVRVLTAALLTAAFASSAAGAWTLEEAAKPYEGASVRGICDGTTSCLAAMEHAKVFSKRTGIDVQLEVADLAAVQTMFLADQLGGSNYYDLVEIPSFSLAAFAAGGLVNDLAPFMDDAALADPEVDFRKDLVESLYLSSTAYDGKLYSIPSKLVLTLLVYRKDLATDEEKANFKEKYGYDMPLPPTTWEQFYDINAFYTRKQGETLAGKPLERSFYGTTVALKRHMVALYDYERYLINFGGTFADAGGNVTLDQGDAAVKALEMMLSLRDVSVPSYMESTWDEQYAEMCNGNTFFSFTWGDTTSYLENATDCPASAGSMGYMAHPGEQLSIAEANQWVIPTSAHNTQAAWLFLQYLGRKDTQVESVLQGANAFRADVYKMPEWTEDSWANKKRDALYNELISSNELVVRAPSTHWLAWTEIIDEEISNAGAGNQDAKTAVANMAARMREAAGQ